MGSFLVILQEHIKISLLYLISCMTEYCHCCTDIGRVVVEPEEARGCSLHGNKTVEQTTYMTYTCSIIVIAFLHSQKVTGNVITYVQPIPQLRIMY